MEHFNPNCICTFCYDPTLSLVQQVPEVFPNMFTLETTLNSVSLTVIDQKEAGLYTFKPSAQNTGIQSATNATYCNLHHPGIGNIMASSILGMTRQISG
jgi:hypothetical protein